MKTLVCAALIATTSWIAYRQKEVETASPGGQQEEASVARAYRDLNGGAHDFSGETGRFRDRCAACHIPHVQAVRPGEDARQEAKLDFYRMTGQREVFVPDRYMPGPTSLVCLGCHDGTVASSTIGSAHAILAGSRAGFDVPEGYARRDHPIGVPYPNEPREYRPRAGLTADGRVRLPEGRVECVSCHDPHASGGDPGMLVMSNRRSALCLACHVK